MHDSSSIDIVYLWVDGNDPTWRRKRAAAAARLGRCQQQEMGAHGNVEGRFRDNDELRFSLRALDRFFPEHGHIYLVTDAQTPAWLKPSDRLTVIDHTSLIPSASLPTFDSGHIESYIHHIPHLSERFFYLNDDVFFGSPLKLADWFWDDGVYAAWSNEPEVEDGPLRRDADSMANASRLSRQWLSKALAQPPRSDSPALPHVVPYEHTFSTFAHSPRPMQRSVLYHLEQLAPELFASVRSTVFRTWDKPTIVSDFVIRWALANGRARIRAHTHLHVQTGGIDVAYQLDLLSSLVGSVDFFCINDTTDDAGPSDPRLAQVRASLEALFPLPSRYERSASTERSHSPL